MMILERQTQSNTHRNSPGSRSSVLLSGLLAALCFVVLPHSSAHAQSEVVRDGTFGPDTMTQPMNVEGVYDIPESFGEREGVNLLHSFSKLDIVAGDTVSFSANPVPTENIVARVTGGASTIDGILESSIPGASLFLLNPDGIMFGSGAQVNVEGSFHVSTAETLIMEDAEQNQFGAFSRDVSVQFSEPRAFGFLGGDAASITLDGTSLGVEDGQTLSLVGGNLILTGAELEAPGGRIELVSVDSSGEVLIEDAAFETSGFSRLGTITLSNDTSIVAGADDDGTDPVAGGRINMRGRRLFATDSSLSSLTLGDVDGDTVGIDIDMSRLIDLRGETEVATGTSEGTGRGGEIRIEAREINLNGESEIGSTTGGDGSSGDVNIDARTLTLRGDAEIGSDVEGDGTARGGNVNIDARVVSLLGDDLRAPEISTDTEGMGDAGNLTIRASEEIRIRSVSGEEAGGLFTNSKPDDDADPGDEAFLGDGGNMRLITDHLSMEGGEISSETEGAGMGGTISIVANVVTLHDQARITAESTDTGNAGSIEITGLEELELDDSEISTRSETSLGGNITIEAEDLVILYDSRLTTDVGSGVGSGGNIDIDPTFIVLDESEIIASADAGNGGNISLVSDFFIASENSVVDASSNLGVDGQIDITAPESDLTASLVDLPSGFFDPSSLASNRCASRTSTTNGSFVVTPRRGLPSSPDGLLMAFDPAAALPLGADSSDIASRASNDGALAFRGGDFVEADTAFAEASVAFANEGNSEKRGVALRAQAQAQQAQGHFEESVMTLRTALVLAETTGDAEPLASTLGGLGNAYLALGKRAEAQQLLERAVDVAKGAGKRGLSATLLNNLGNQYAERRDLEEALAAYEEAADLAGAVGRPVEQAKALSNAARAAVELGLKNPAKKLLVNAHASALGLDAIPEKANILIHLAKTWRDFVANVPARRAEYLNRSYEALREAANLGDALSDDRLLSYAYGNLASLYRVQDRSDEALYLNRLALQSAEIAEAPEALYRWHWQDGQLLWAKGEKQEAIDAYRRAVAVLEDVRPEGRGQYGAAAANFRRSVAPVYLELVNALFDRADEVADAGLAHAHLVEARARVEQLRAAELRDYYRDECVAEIEAKEVSIETVEAGVAVVYPVLFADHTELLVALPSGLSRYTVPVGENAIAAAARRFRTELQQPYNDAYRGSSRRFYNWLVRPYVAELVSHEIETLVFVPDGPLHTIPMAALLDGDTYLSERYSIAVTQSLRLVDPQPLERGSLDVLLAGVSEAVQGFPELANVPDELAAIQALHGGNILLDRSFGLEAFKQAMAATHPAVVHLATHAVFSGEAETSFLLTHDDRLTMERLSDLVGQRKFDEEPLELLMLSACETAAGNDRAGLGLAGVAIRAGARSVVGSLWSISDAATRELVEEFYRQLLNPEVNKAEALQNAQAKLRASDEFSHPFYWSAFLVINNWL